MVVFSQKRQLFRQKYLKNLEKQMSALLMKVKSKENNKIRILN
jgi:hypothetical protein